MLRQQEHHKMDKSRVRLPVDDIVPSKYFINYDRIDFDACTFNGQVRILVEVKRVIRTIKIHALQLWLSSASISCESGTSIQMVSVLTDHEGQTAELMFAEEIAVGSAELTINFQGILNDQLAGFYRSYYEVDGERRVMATTQMEPTDARRAFPCWDEPAIKAVFELTVVTPVDRVAISNTPVVETEVREVESPGLVKRKEKVWRFAETPVMSTYLVAVVVGEFDQISKFTKTGVQVSVYTPLGKAKQGTFALDVACKALELYEDLYGVKYPLTKSDLLAIPDFAAGAMENWGCVTYREVRVLVEEGSSSLDTKKRIARTVCHELAHQWFGNLVTMEWWTHLWLNEGFARYMEFIAVTRIFPDWDYWTDFDHEVFGTALRVDALLSSHPVEVKVHHPDEINAIFDIISYAKGASVIRMISEYVGCEKFMEGIKLYLEKYAYSNTVTENLWNSLEEASGMEVEHLAATWTGQMGYPLLSLELEEGKVVVKQERFYEMGATAGFGLDEEPKWRIPVKLIAEGDATNHLFVLGVDDDGKAEAELGKMLTALKEAKKWFKLNAGHTSFFRTKYLEGHLQALLKDGSGVFQDPLTSADKIGLLNDAYSLSKSGYQSINTYLEFAFKLKEEQDLAVWEELVAGFRALLGLYSEQPFYEAFQAKVRDLFATIWSECGCHSKPNEPHRLGTLRAKLIGLMAAAGDEAVIEEAVTMFERYAANPQANPISADNRLTIFGIAMKQASEEEYEKMLKVWRESSFPEEKRHALSALGRVGSNELREKTWALIRSGEIRLQDVWVPMYALAASQQGAAFMFEKFQAEYDSLFVAFGSNSMTWPFVVGASIQGPYTEEHVEAVENMFSSPSVNIGSAMKKYQQSLEGLRAKVFQVKRDRNSLADCAFTQY